MASKRQRNAYPKYASDALPVVGAPPQLNTAAPKKNTRPPLPK